MKHEDGDVRPHLEKRMVQKSDIYALPELIQSARS